MGFWENKNGIAVLDMCLHRVKEGFRLLAIARQRKRSNHRFDGAKGGFGDGFIRAKHECSPWWDKPNGRKESIPDRSMVSIDEETLPPQSCLPEFSFPPNLKAIDELADNPKNGDSDDVIENPAKKPIERRFVIELEVFRKGLMLKALRAGEVVFQGVVIIDNLFFFHAFLSFFSLAVS